jgi:hypothetical protein
MSLHTLANHLQTAGRGEDKVLVHMTPGEVNGLQSLAMAHGGSLSINPETGLPEAGFLSSILPMVAAVALNAVAPGAGAAVGGAFGATGAAASQLGTGLITGGITAAMTGSLKNGLLAGLGAYGASGIMGGLSGAAGAADGLTAGMTPPISANPQIPGVQGGVSGMSGAANFGGVAPSIAPTGNFAGINGTNVNTMFGGAAPVQPYVAPTAFTPGTGNAPIAPTDVNALAQQRQFAEQAAKASAPSSVIAQAGKPNGLFGNMDMSKLFSMDFIKENKGNYLAAMAPLLMEEEEKKKKAAEQVQNQMLLGGTPVYKPSVRAPGGSSERLYFADGGLSSLPVENMSQQNTVGANSSYPMANIKPYGYSVPRNNPISQNVLQPESYQNLDPYTGEQKFASGGIIALKKGGTPAPAAPKTEAQINEENAAKDFAEFLKNRTAEKNNAIKEYDARKNDITKDYTQRINDFNRDTSSEVSNKQKDMYLNEYNDLKKDAKSREQKAELSSWLKSREKEYNDWKSSYQKERENELKEIQTNQKNDLANWQQERNSGIGDIERDIKERQALRDFDASVFKSGYSGFSSDISGDDLSSLAKGYDTEIGKQKSEAEKAKAALEQAKKTGIQSLIDRAQDTYNTQQGEYDEASKAKDSRLNQFREETKRSQGLQARGFNSPETPVSSQTPADVASIQAKIDKIKARPQQGGQMGMPASLSPDQEAEIKKLEGQLSVAKSTKLVYDPKTGQYVPQQDKPTYQKLSKAPGMSSTKKIMEENDVRNIYEELAGRSPTQTELNKYVGKMLSEADLSKNIGTLAELTMAQKFNDDDLNQQAQYYWGRPMTKGELAFYKDPANKISNFNSLRSALTSSGAYLENLNKINQSAFTSAQKSIQAQMEGPASMEEIASYYQQVFNKPPTMEELSRLKGTGLSISELQDQIKGSQQYQEQLIKPLVPGISTSSFASTPAISQDQINAYRSQQVSPYQSTTPALQSLPTGNANVAQYNPFAVQPKATIEGALPYSDVSQRLGLTNLYSQLGEPGLNAQKTEYGLPAVQSGLTSPQQNIFGFSQYPTIDEAVKAALAAQSAGKAPVGMAMGGMAMGGEAGYNLGGYSDGGRLLKGPGDGVSDSIPASIGNRQPARLADGEFVVPARIVSELGNGSTEAGARKLYAMMDRVQKARRHSIGKGKVAVNSRAEKLLPA